MKLRIKAANFLIKFGKFIQSCAVIVMRPDDLVEFSRRFYSNPDGINFWCDEQRNDSGLRDLEESLLTSTGLSKGHVLLLGLGGGREAISLAKRGFEITGIDYVPQMVESAIANARRSGVQISGMVQDITDLNVPASRFDLAWLSSAMYSSIPTRKKRIELLQRVGSALRAGGYFVFEFSWHPELTGSASIDSFKKMLAWLCAGNVQYEKGDMLKFNREFSHSFTNTEELRKELAQAELELIDIQTNDTYEVAGAVVQKRE